MRIILRITINDLSYHVLHWIAVYMFVKYQYRLNVRRTKNGLNFELKNQQCQKKDYEYQT